MHQFKTLDDLREKIKEYEGFMARPTRKLSHPTLYRKRDAQEGDVILKGVREKDWFFSEDGKWALPHDQMGLSFSSHWQHLKGVFKMKEKHNSGAAINVYWVLEHADLPSQMEFIPDRKKKGHYLHNGNETNDFTSISSKTKTGSLPNVRNQRCKDSTMIEYAYEEEKIVALFFSELLDDGLVTSILEKGLVTSIEEATHLSRFFWKMVDKSAEGNLTLPCDGSSEYWTEKLYNSIGGYLEKAGFEKEWDKEIDRA